mmetsp:Transcript_27100/g.78635  ORF Transcript_27100/g.78635 Transcript_27100/m.78635 type:complete len:731 (+) Transcript_27100:68-2260(+)
MSEESQRWRDGPASVTHVGSREAEEVPVESDSNGALGGDGERWRDWADFLINFEGLDRKRPDIGSAFVIRTMNPSRMAWVSIIALLLAYTGTIFLYRMCFVTFRIEAIMGEDGLIYYSSQRSEEHDGWWLFDKMIYYIFCVDLVVNFFFAYEDENGNEVLCMRRIAKEYLRTYFVINLLGCIPEDLLEYIIGSDDAPVALNQGARSIRLTRVSRLARLVRLARLGKLANLRKSPRLKAIMKKKGFRLINLMLGLVWIIHLLACGWYLLAALHDNALNTWVARRPVDVTGDPGLLIDSGPAEQWVHSMYFILTVFTTVGFGDMSAVTVPEILYVAIVMAIGAVVHSIIISQVITLVTSIDKTNEFVEKQAELVEAFADHTEVDDVARDAMRGWIRQSAKKWVSHQFDKQAMKDMFTTGVMPRTLLGSLPTALFMGKLVQNSFLRANTRMGAMPPRLAVLIALVGQKSTFETSSIIYQTQDFAFSMFLVLSGTFAYVAFPSKEGGVPYAQPIKVEQRRKNSLDRGKSDFLASSMAWLHAQAGKKKQPHVEDDASSLMNLTHLCPYQLFSTGSHFGEIELFSGSQRKTTARCEVSGTLLALNRQDLKQLCEEFPQFKAKWTFLASRRERSRIKQQLDLTERNDVLSLARRTITRALERYKARGKTASSQGVFGASSEEPARSQPSLPSPQDTNAAAHAAEVAAMRRDMDKMNRKLDSILRALSNHGEVARVVV